MHMNMMVADVVVEDDMNINTKIKKGDVVLIIKNII
jgi:hypothetical protein